MDGIILAMGVNFGDIDNDGFLDCYIGTGNPDLRSLLPNRMMRNVSGQRFAEATFSGGFGHIQKGHGSLLCRHRQRRRPRHLHRLRRGLRRRFLPERPV